MEKVPYRVCDRPEEQFQDEVFQAGYGEDYFKDGTKGVTLSIGTIKRARRFVTLTEGFVNCDHHQEVILSPDMAETIGRGLIKVADAIRADAKKEEADA